MNNAGTIVLDASAVLCLIFSEPGADRIEAVMSGAAMSSVNYAEVLGKLIERGFDADEIVADLAGLDIDVVPLDRDMAETAARLRPETRAAGLSLGDRCCLALARHRGARAVTTDKAWKNLGEPLGIEIDVAR